MVGHRRSGRRRGRARARHRHRVSARDGLLRASNYYRSAEFFLHGSPDDPRIDAAYFRSVACFPAAAARFTPVVQPVQIPYEGTVLHGYLYRAAGAALGERRPAMVLHNGFDGTAEEMHLNGAIAGPERGYHVLTFDGPGQPAARHRDGLVFRSDWENVVSPVLDWLLERPCKTTREAASTLPILTPPAPRPQMASPPTRPPVAQPDLRVPSTPEATSPQSPFPPVLKECLAMLSGCSPA